MPQGHILENDIKTPAPAAPQDPERNMEFIYKENDTPESFPLLKRTWAEIDLDAVEHNFRVLKERAGGARFLAVVKADAYGHGAVHVAKLMQELSADYLAVSNLEEAIEIRRADVSLPILILGHTPEEYVPHLIRWNVTQAVSNRAKGLAYSEAVQAYRAETGDADAVLKVHIKLDTGMTRVGFLCAGDMTESAVASIAEVCSLPGIDAEGIFTHFSVSDEPDDPDNVRYTEAQLALFTEMTERLAAAGCTFRIRHCANSGAVVNFTEATRFDMVRPGILLYGCGDGAAELGLKPAMRLMTTVSVIRYPGEGASISYGRMYTLKKKSRVGVLPIGYADGLLRALSNRAVFYSAAGPVRQIGRICMDMCMVDLDYMPDVDIGSEIEIFGPENPVDGLARTAGTIPYELLCAVNKRVPRIFLRGGRVIGSEHRMFL